MPTLLDQGKMPDLTALRAASSSLGKGLKRDDLVIVESAVYPGVTSGLVRSILEESSGLAAGEDFGLAFCCERMDPGTRNRIDNTPRVLGGYDERSAAAALAVYQVVVRAEIVKVRNCETAEMVKLVENVYRDVNIAYVNEIALLCEQIDVDVLGEARQSRRGCRGNPCACPCPYLLEIASGLRPSQ